MRTRWTSLALIPALLASTAGSHAAAQTPPQAQAPAPPPAAPAEPEPVPAAGTERVPYQRIEVTGAHRVGAAALNVLYVPGKVITCGAGVGVATLMMLATFGSQYDWAVRFVEEGCGHPWYLKPENVAGRDPRDER